MKKIPTIFKRDPENMSRLLDDPHPDCSWVFAGQGVATRKYDGTCCMVKHGALYKRREVKPGKDDPINFTIEEEDPNTGKRVGWVPVDLTSKENKYHAEAFDTGEDFADGTYELLGPKIQGNPEGYETHVLFEHAAAFKMLDAPTNYDALAEWLKGIDCEGLVWHHPDGRMAKIKLKDFGIKRSHP